MANTDLERLVVQLSADIKGYQREMQKAAGVTNRQARAIEARWMQSERNLNAIGKTMAAGLIAPLSGVAAAITTREVMSYADAWTRAKNSLSVAGVTGAKQVAVLQSLYDVAQRNSAPVENLAGVYGRASMAQRDLGASTEDLIQFTDVVGMALKASGKSAQEAAGALQQLGQLLGMSRVQAEEFGSILEGAPTLLMAVASGIDAAGGSVSKLKELVNEGAISNREFFRGALKGYMTVAAMAESAAQTIDQGMLRVRNALTKYIGETDESFGVSARLIAGLNALASNFDQTADVVLKVAGIIAGALVGRAIGGLLATLGPATVAVTRFVAALRAAQSMAGIATAIGGIGAAAGPIGLVVGGTAVAALTLFAASSGEASAGAALYAKALREVEDAAKGAADGVTKASGSIEAGTINVLINALRKGEQEVKRTVDDIVRSMSGILDQEQGRDFLGIGRIDEGVEAQLRALVANLNTGVISAVAFREQVAGIANATPALQWLVDATRDYVDAAVSAEGSQRKINDQLAATPGGTLTRLAQETKAADAAMLQAQESAVRLFGSVIRIAQTHDIISPTETSRLQELREKLAAGSISADDARAALMALGATNPRFGAHVASLLPLIDKLRETAATAHAAKAAMDALAGQATSPAAFRRAEIGSMTDLAAYEKMQQAGRDFLSDLSRRNALTRDQLALETKISEIRRQAEKDGVKLSDDQVRQAARDQLAADARRSAEGKRSSGGRADEYQRETEQLHRSTEALQLEIDTLGKSTFETEKARAAQELLNAAKAAGRAITPDLTAEIDREAAAHARVASALEEAKKRQEQLDEAKRKAADSSREVQDGLSEAASSGLSAWRKGEDAIDAVTDALDRLTDRLMKMISDQLFAQLFGGVSGGGFSLAGLFGGGGGGSIGLYDRGGYTGPGGKYQPAGVVHKGEYVFDKAATSKIGVANLEALRRGYANGGPVGGLYVPRLSHLAAGRSAGTAAGAASVNVSVNVANAPAPMQVRQSDDGKGGVRLDLIFDEQAAAAMRKPGSRTQKAMRAGYGARPVLPRY